MRRVALTAHVALAAFFLFGAAERSLPLLLLPFDRPLAALLTLALLAAALNTVHKVPAPRSAAAAVVVLCLAGATGPGSAADAIALAAGTVWLGSTAASAGTRSAAFGLAAGVALQPIAPLIIAHRLAGGAVALLAVLLLAGAAPRHVQDREALERRAPRLRRRSLVAIGALLFLARGARGSAPGAAGADGSAAAVLLAAAAVAALLVAAALPWPWPRDRRLIAGGAAAAVLLLVAAPLLGTLQALAIGMAHTTLVVLLARAPLPAGARRSTAWTVLAWGTWLALAALSALLAAGAAAALAAAVAALALAGLPRPGGWQAKDAGERLLPGVS